MLKLSPFVLAASICLRCQYRLSVQRIHRRISRLPSVNVQQVQRYTPSRSLRQEQALLDEIETLDGAISQSITKYESEHHSRRFAGQRRIHPQRKDSLGVDVLGEPAEVLVLQDMLEHEKHNHGAIWNPSLGSNKDRTEEVLSSLDMLGEIEGEQGLVDADQVFRNIENVRATWEARSKLSSSLVTVEDCKGLTSLLMNGFTVKQLAAYLKRTSSPSNSDLMDLQVEYSGKLYARSCWIPGTTSMEQVRGPKLMEPAKDAEEPGAVVQTKPERQSLHKPTLVDRILRYCWQVTPKRDETSLGELNIRMQWMHLHLIMNHKRGILKQLSESYGAKISASKKNRIIRVTSDYDTCLDVLKIIVLTLENVRAEEYDLPVQFKRHRHSEDFHEPGQTMLRQVEQLTNTIIETKSSETWRREIYIHYIGPSDVDLHDARRLMSQILKSKHAIDQKLIWASPLQPSETVPVPIDVGSGLPLVDRDQQWSRWSGPDMRQTDIENGHDSVRESPGTLAEGLSYEKEASKALHRFLAAHNDVIPLNKDSCSHWIPERSYWDSAALGQLVFPTKAANQRYVRVKGQDKGDEYERLRLRLCEWRREFVNLVPGAVRSLENLGLESLALGLESEETLLIRLSPSFRNSALQVPFEALPDLEIDIAIDNDSQTTSIKDVRTSFKRIFDFLHPHKTMDVRFVRRTCVSSDPQNLDPRILQFLQSSNLDIWGTERLQTPTELALDIPQHAFRRHSGSSTSETPLQSLVDYTFTSLEHRSSLSIPFRQAGSWSDLTYTSIEAGKIGGRSSLLSLSHPISDPENRITVDDIDSDNTLRTKSASPNSFSGPSNELHSSSLLRKANALIDMIETRPDTGDDGISDEFDSRAKKARQASLWQSARAQRLHLNLADDSPGAPLRRVIGDKHNYLRPVRS